MKIKRAMGEVLPARILPLRFAVSEFGVEERRAKVFGQGKVGFAIALASRHLQRARNRVMATSNRVFRAD